MGPNSIISISSYKAELCRFSYSNDMLENNEQYSLVHYGLYYSIGKRIASLLNPEITQSIRRFTYA